MLHVGLCGLTLRAGHPAECQTGGGLLCVLKPPGRYSLIPLQTFIEYTQCAIHVAGSEGSAEDKSGVCTEAPG